MGATKSKMCDGQVVHDENKKCIKYSGLKTLWNYLRFLLNRYLANYAKNGNVSSSCPNLTKIRIDDNYRYMEYKM